MTSTDNQQQPNFIYFFRPDWFILLWDELTRWVATREDLGLLQVSRSAPSGEISFHFQIYPNSVWDGLLTRLASNTHLQ